MAEQPIKDLDLTENIAEEPITESAGIENLSEKRIDDPIDSKDLTEQPIEKLVDTEYQPEEPSEVEEPVETEFPSTEPSREPKDIETLPENEKCSQTERSAGNYVTVCGAVVDSTQKEIYELPLDKDGFLKKATLTEQFPSALSIKYKNPETGAIRILKEENGVIHPPPEGWGKTEFIIHMSVKRSAGSPIPSSVGGKFPRTGQSNRPVLFGNAPLSPPTARPVRPALFGNMPSAGGVNNGYNGPMDLEYQLDPMAPTAPPASTFGSPAVSSTGLPLYCEVCNITLNDNSQAIFHYDGRRHKDNVMAQQMRQMPPPMPAMFGGPSPGGMGRGFGRPSPAMGPPPMMARGGGGRPMRARGRGFVAPRGGGFRGAAGRPMMNGRGGGRGAGGRGGGRPSGGRPSRGGIGARRGDSTPRKTQPTRFDHDEFEDIQKF